MATQNDNNHAAITSVLQAKIPKHHEPAMCKNKQNTSKQPLQCGLLPALAEPSPHSPRTRGTCHRRPEPLYPKKHMVSCPSFPPKRSPCNIHTAITIRFATSGCKPASPDKHGNTKRQQSCGHYNAFCKQRFQNTMNLQCARINKTHRSSHYIADYSRPWPNPARTRRAHKVPFIAGRSHFTRKSTRFPAPPFSQNEAHATSMQPLQCVLQHQVPNPHLPTNMATQSDNNHAAITLRFASKDSHTSIH